MTKIRWDSRLTTNKISKYDISFLRKKNRNENYKSHQAITTTFSNRRIKSFSFLLFLYHRPEVLWFDPARPSLIQNDTSHCIRHRCKRHKKRKKKRKKNIERRKVHVEDGRNDLSPGVIIWVDVEEGVYSITRWGSLFASTGRIFQQDDPGHGPARSSTPSAGQWCHVAQFRARRPGLFFVAGIRSCRACPTASLPQAPIMSWKINGPRTIRNETQTKQVFYFIPEPIELIPWFHFFWRSGSTIVW